MKSILQIKLIICISIFLASSHQLSLSVDKDEESITLKKLETFFLEECECIKLSNCTKMTDIISRVKLPISPAINYRIRRTSCGFQDKEPLICCPHETRLIKPESVEVVSFRIASSDSNDIGNTNSNWIWPKNDIEYPYSYNNDILDDHSEYKNSNFNKENKYPFNSNNNNNNNYYNDNESVMKNLIDFEDEKTHKNCPPSFYDEYNSFYDNHKIPHNKKDEDYTAKYPISSPPAYPYNNDHHYHHHFHQFGPPNNYWNNHGLGPHHRFNPSVYPSHFYPGFQSPQVPTTSTESNINDDNSFQNNNNKNSGSDTTSNQLNSEQCGISVSTRIIGGTRSSPGQFPWMARIAYRNLSSGTISYRCSGSFINQLHMLTAAHCVTNLIDNLQVSHIRLSDSLDSTSSQIEYQIEQLIPHQGYDTPKYANDIALIRISPPGNAFQITPICLPTGQYSKVDRNLAGKIGTVAGWLSSSRGVPRSNELEMNWIQLPIVNRTNCAKIYADFSLNFRTPIIVSRTQICAQGTENMDACQGDSGGPLMLENTDNRNPKLVLLGIVSFGPRTCGISNFPGVYTRISSHTDWINRNIVL